MKIPLGYCTYFQFMAEENLRESPRSILKNLKEKSKTTKSVPHRQKIVFIHDKKPI